MRGRLLLVALALVVLAGGAWFMLRGQAERLAGDGSLIAAPPGPYRVAPDTAGGMEVEGQGSAAFATSEGAEAGGRIDVGQAIEPPVAGTRAATGAPGVSATGRSIETRVPASGGPLKRAEER